MRITHQEYGHSRNDLHATICFMSANAVRWRTELRRNFYDHQSSFRADRWDGAQWQRVHTVLDTGGLLLMQHGPHRPDAGWEEAAVHDAERIVRTAARIIGEPGYLNPPKI